MIIRPATPHDREAIEVIYSDARAFMRASGNHGQWTGGYPTAEIICEDIALERLFVAEDGCDILAVFCYFHGEDPTYRVIEGGEWLDGGEYGVIHRIAVSKNDGKGTVGYIFQRMFMPYSSLKKAYPILVKHKWLMPFCQMARWFKLVTGEKTKKAIEEIRISSTTSEADVNSLQAFLGEIGLREIKK